MIKKANAFPGGVHPAYSKSLTAALAIETPPLFQRYIVPVAQHIGRDLLRMRGQVESDFVLGTDRVGHVNNGHQRLELRTQPIGVDSPAWAG